VSPDVCVIGEINPDLILYGLPQPVEPEREILADGFRLTLGSSSAIFAHNLSALSTKVGMISKVGTDPLGKFCLDRLIEGGVDVSRVKTSSDTPTGVTVILAQPASRFILTYPGTMFELSYEDLDFDYIFSARHVHLSSFFLHRRLRPQIAEVFRAAKSKNLTTSLDTNDDPQDKWDDDLADVVRFIDILFVNEREARKIARTDDLNSALAKLSQIARMAVVKLGAHGVIAREESTEWRCPGLAVDVIDTVGAGDSFDAGYIHRFLKGAGQEACLRYANVVGAFSTTKEGGTEAFRDPASMAQFIRERRGESPGGLE